MSTLETSVAKRTRGNPEIAKHGERYQFQPGNSAARRGPSSILKNLRMIANAETPEEVQLALERARTNPVVKAYLVALAAEDARTALAAADAITDRVDGKATQRTEVTGAGGGAILLAALRPAEGDDEV